MVKRPFLILGIASFLSVYLMAMLPLKWAVVSIAAATVVGIVGWCRRTQRSAVAAALACVGIVLAGSGYVIKEVTVVRPALAYAGNTAYAVMRVKESIADGRAYYVETEEGDLPRGMRLCLWVDEETEAAKLGDLFRGEVMLEAAYDEDTAYREQSAKAYGCYLYAWPSGESLVSADGSDSLSWWDTWLYAMRDSIHESLHSAMPEREAALCESMMVGEQSHLPEETQSAFRGSGVYHLLVVSGLHLSLLTGVVLAVLRAMRLKRPLCLAITALIVLMFAALCGFSMSIVRSMWMTLLSLFAMMLHRRSDGLNTIGLTAFVMILFDPFCVMDLGWQLSFAATLGMVGLMPAWTRDVTARVGDRFPRMRRITTPLLTTIGAALCATLLTQPLTTMYFEELSLLFLPANLVCVPLSTVVIVLSFIAALFHTVVPFLSEWIYSLVQVLSGMLHDCAVSFSSPSWSSFSACLPHVILWLFALPLSVVIAYRKQAMRGVWRIAALMLCVLCLSHVAFVWMNRGVSTVAVGGAPTLTVLIKTDEASGLLCTADTASLREAEALLREESVDSLSFMLVCPGDDEEPLEWSDATVEHLVLTTTASSYASLPSATRTDVLADGRTLKFSSSGVISCDNHALRLRLGETSALICRTTCDAAELPEEWCESDLLILDGGLPKHSGCLASERVVIFASQTRSRTVRDSLPHRFDEVWMAEVSQPPVFLTRGSRDILLRPY